MIVGLAHQQKVEALLWRLSEKSADWKLLFEQALPNWQRAFFLNSARNALLQKTVETVLSRLAEQNISVITLKGWAQIIRLYAESGVRPTADIDILIRESEIETAVNILQDVGFTFADSRADLTGLSYQNELAMINESLPSKPRVELHWQLFDAPYWQRHVEIDWFWETAVSAKLGDIPILLLSNEASFLYESAHLQLHHTGQELKWLTDLGLLVAKSDLRWPLILEQAAQMRLTLPLRDTCNTLAADWAVRIPDDVLSYLNVYTPSKDEAIQYAQMQDHFRNPGQRFIADMQSIGNIAGGLQFGRENLFPSKSYMRKRYEIENGKWVWPYYLHRWRLGFQQLLKQTKK